MSLKAIERLTVGRHDWDAFVDGSEESWLWHRFDLQDALSTWNSYYDVSFAVADGDSKGCRILALAPIYLIDAVSLNSLVGIACVDSLTEGRKRRVLDYAKDHLLRLAREYGVSEINLALSPMAPAYSGERCPRVNPLLHMGCENTLGQTWVVDLRQGKETLWSRMEGRARTAVRKAESLGVTVREARPTVSDLDLYYGLHVETYNRTGVPPHPKEYFKAIWNDFLKRGLARILFAERNGEAIAAENFGVFKKRAIYWTGASSAEGLDCEANSLVQWTAMQWMSKNGFEWYETGEAFPHLREGKLKGLNDFKKSFGGELYPVYRGRIRIEGQKNDQVEVRKRGSLKEIYFQWMDLSKGLFRPLLGTRAVDLVEKTGNAVLNVSIAAKKGCEKRRGSKLTELHFIKPFWFDEEIRAGLGDEGFDKSKAHPLMDAELRERLGLSDEAIVFASSGRTAIQLCLKILKSKYPERRKVILPSYGCRGTYDPIIWNDLVPVFVDIDNDLLPNARKLPQLFGDDVLACLLVNLTGKRMDTTPVIREARKRGVLALEDNCQNVCALPQRGEDSPDVLFYSFGMGKALMATGGGAVITSIFKDEFELEGGRLMATSEEDAARRFRYFHSLYYLANDRASEDMEWLANTLYGYSSMSCLDARILLFQLQRMEEIVRLRQRNAGLMREKLVSYPRLFHLQSSDNHIYTKLSLKLANRTVMDDFRRFMNNRRIELENMYIPLHLRDFCSGVSHSPLVATEKTAPLVLNLPVRPNLTETELRRITDAIVAFGESYES